MACQLVAIGASWGGLHAVGEVLAALPEDFAPPVVVAQHRARESSAEMLGRALGGRTALPVCEAGDKDPIQGGRVHLAPPDYHLLVESGHFELSVDAPVSYSRPSIDVLFESVADSYGARAVGVLLTGANADGAAGLLRLREAGGLTIVQDPDDAERPEMPAAALRLGAADRVCPLSSIGPLLADTCSAGRPA
ncbi:MAG: chemotaxis protein CheB [Actinomycetota bacterium]|nr:chemotaxis protein CheB [Actinomycetota bacterium]